MKNVDNLIFQLMDLRTKILTDKQEALNFLDSEKFPENEAFLDLMKYIADNSETIDDYLKYFAVTTKALIVARTIGNEWANI